MATLQKILKHDLVERIGHWVHLVNMILLVLSGLQIHYPGFNLFGSMNNARLVHFVDMYLFFFIGVFYVYQFFAMGKWRVSGPTRSNLEGFGGTLKYYLFLREEEPEFRYYNPLQVVTYFFLFGLSAFMALIGFSLYWPVEFGPVVGLLGGLMAVRQLHFVLSWVFIAFTILHIYLVLTQQPLALAKSMVTGVYWRRVETASEAEESAG